MLGSLCSCRLPGVSCVWDLLKDRNWTYMESALHQTQELMDPLDLYVPLNQSLIAKFSVREAAEQCFRKMKEL